MFLNIFEILDIIIIIMVMGFVFMTSVKPARKVSEDILEKYLKKSSRFDWHSFWFAALVTAPAIVLHEFGHKITALSFGMSATFHAAYIWLAIALVLRLVGSSFIFLVPAYVSISGAVSTLPPVLIAAAGTHAIDLANALISFAGPFVNLIIFLIALIVLKTKKNISAREVQFWVLSKNINLFLFVFNLIPIPPFDGFQFFRSLGLMAGLWT